MPRFITFRFDDGFIEGARKAIACLYPNTASFFIVSGLVTGDETLDHIAPFAGGDFGSLDEWRAIAAMGHDVQPHSVTHPLFNRLGPERQIAEVRGSLDLVRKIHEGPYVFCFPYNDIVDIDLVAAGVSAAGFASRTSDEPIAFNDLDNGDLDMFRLRSWAVRERHFSSIIDQLARLRDRTWTILAFHSFDGEGHEPWAMEAFSRLVENVRAAGFQIVTVREMLGVVASVIAGAVP